MDSWQFGNHCSSNSLLKHFRAIKLCILRFFNFSHWSILYWTLNNLHIINLIKVECLAFLIWILDLRSLWYLILNLDVSVYRNFELFVF
jgi:hypothetical protein